MATLWQRESIRRQSEIRMRTRRFCPCIHEGSACPHWHCIWHSPWQIECHLAAGIALRWRSLVGHPLVSVMLMEKQASQINKLVLAEVQRLVRVRSLARFEDVSRQQQEVMGRETLTKADLLPVNPSVAWQNSDISKANRARTMLKEPPDNVIFPEHINGIGMAPESRGSLGYCFVSQADGCNMQSKDGGTQNARDGRITECRLGLHLCANSTKKDQPAMCMTQAQSATPHRGMPRGKQCEA